MRAGGGADHLPRGGGRPEATVDSRRQAPLRRRLGCQNPAHENRDRPEGPSTPPGPKRRGARGDPDPAQQDGRREKLRVGDPRPEDKADPAGGESGEGDPQDQPAPPPPIPPVQPPSEISKHLGPDKEPRQEGGRRERGQDIGGPL